MSLNGERIDAVRLVDELVLGECRIELRTNAQVVADFLRETFVDWLNASGLIQRDAVMALSLTEEVVGLPEDEPYFVDARTDILAAFAGANGATILHFFDGALVEISADKRHITGQITQNVFKTGAIDDVIMVSLAPLLRTHGYYLLHASGVVKDNEAVLFVGQSFSGKTTTCLNLVLNGWALLGNDVILLEKRADTVYAFPLPDRVSLRPKTIDLLPQLKPFMPSASIDGQLTVHAGAFVNYRWAAPAPVTAICFPSVAIRPKSELIPQPQALSLARLMEESVDMWDRDSVERHTQMLADVVRQARGYHLRLGQDVDTLPAWLASNILDC